MEADSIHSTIEKAKRGAPVYSPDEWVTIIAIARRKNPYQVDKMIFSDILDLKAMHKGLVHNLKKNQDGDAVRWMKVKALRVIKSQPHLLYYKETWGCDEYNVINLLKIGNRRERSELPVLVLQPKFVAPLPITNAKLKDLLDLCRSGAIPKRAHSFYEGLNGIVGRNCLALLL